MFYKNGWMGHINYSEKFSNDSDTITTNSSFEPILIPKRTTRLKGLEDKIISLYAKGMSVSDIQEQLIELYTKVISFYEIT